MSGPQINMLQQKCEKRARLLMHDGLKAEGHYLNYGSKRECILFDVSVEILTKALKQIAEPRMIP